MSLKIKSIKAELVDLGITKPYTIAYKTIDRVENLFVKVKAENGLIGLGTANTSEMVMGEGNINALEQLSEESLEPLTGKDLTNFHTVMDEIYQRFTSTGARAALDIALHDLFTKFLGIPLVSFYGQKIHSLYTSVTIGIMDINETITEAREYIRKGFKILKVKLGKSVEEDIERLKELRAVIPSEIKIRIDANQGWTVNETINFFQETKKLDIELIEQPLPQRSIDEMRALPGELKALIAADESLITPYDAFQLAKDPKAAGIYNIKLMKCGGITKAKEISVIAENAGIDLMWGCNDESRISISAALHTALSCPGTKYLDLDGSFDLEKDLVTGGFILKGGALSISGKPGLGIESIH